jgi:hypothetical protein
LHLSPRQWEDVDGRDKPGHDVEIYFLPRHARL